MEDGVMYTGPQGVRTVEEAMAEAENASSPAETVRWQHAAIKLLSARLADVELVLAKVGEPSKKAQKIVDHRARRRLDEMQNGGLGL
jgi:hypothetical protein